jgi:pilus assembly protein CpaB
VNAKWVFGLAIVAGLVAVFLVQRQMDNMRGETITVYKAAADHAAGEVLGSQIEEVTIPAGLFPNLFQEAPTSELVDLVQTSPLREGVRTGDILLFRHFDSAVDRGVLADIAPGMKAISIPVDEVSSVAFFVQPGDTVDVLATFLGSNDAAGPQVNAEMFELSTRAVVQAAKVLAVGDKHRPTDRQMTEPYSSVTLLVTMEEAAKLIFARDFFGASMTLVLRGENDTAVDPAVPSVGVNTADFNRIGNQPEAAVTR